ncbi:hypothetical protein GF322_00645 [Candidatus Dependentiae bacterium]|nr:hypothetical protein [Candidatus Dependentiae bacterium]
MITAKKVHLILIMPAILLILVMAGCLNKKYNSSNNKTNKNKCVEEHVKE